MRYEEDLNSYLDELGCPELTEEQQQKLIKDEVQNEKPND